MSTPAPHSYVFGYGSLVDLADLVAFLRREWLGPDDYTFCHLLDHRRSWNVARDNHLDLPGYKFYRDPKTGERPAIFITYVNVVPAPGGWVNGVAFRVEDQELERIRQRERNYRLTEIGDLLDMPFDAPVYTSIGLEAARERYRRASSEGRARIPRAYFERIEGAFRCLGEEPWAVYRASTDPPEVPVAELERVDC